MRFRSHLRPVQFPAIAAARMWPLRLLPARVDVLHVVRSRGVRRHAAVALLPCLQRSAPAAVSDVEEDADGDDGYCDARAYAHAGTDGCGVDA